jgi:hypothetical protein
MNKNDEIETLKIERDVAIKATDIAISQRDELQNKIDELQETLNEKNRRLLNPRLVELYVEIADSCWRQREMYDCLIAENNALRTKLESTRETNIDIESRLNFMKLRDSFYNMEDPLLRTLMNKQKEAKE